ncbi:hypothetical protein BJY04DRAFT_217002 [Aspergillus karnatakaensis]|uniref:uncharacterized protein n=1 Tax=Aspergillus karnatakaensis TaxID=1810916 RepID=UPI003CCDEC80
MASGPSITALVSEPVGKPYDAPSKPSTSDGPQSSGDNQDLKPRDGLTLSPSYEGNTSKDIQPTQQDSAPTNGISNGTSLEPKQEQPNIGEKREHEVTSATEVGAQEPVEPNTKKHRTSEKHQDASKDTLAPTKAEPTTATEKKKGGRPKKTKEAIKKVIPTDGIGSRTRSRTKVVS